ncbi:MAG: transcriptional repressor LexA [Thermotogae bacterium]|nr:transcriptional repressor LexA [Thermotogota bacterium]
MELTSRQRQILEYIVEYEREHGYPPTIREICEAFGISSPRGVSKHLEALEKKGYIERSKGRSRGIRILKSAQQDVVLEEFYTIPVVGVIAAGDAIEAIESVSEYIPIPERFLNRGHEYYALKVKGNSMVEAHILDGDYAIIRKQAWANEGDIVVVLIEGQSATLKRFHHRGDTVVLEPANSMMNPIELPVDKVIIQGKLVGIMRWYT